MANPELTGKPSRFDEKARKLIRATRASGRPHRTAAAQLARGLGWFSIGLGLVEVFAARPLGRLVGLQGREPLLQACGVRELVSGAGLLAARRAPAAHGWMWARVVGDALDLSLLAAAAIARRRAGHPVAALVAVAGVAVLDAACTRTLKAQCSAARQTTDYSSRSGLGQPAGRITHDTGPRADIAAERPVPERETPPTEVNAVR